MKLVNGENFVLSKMGYKIVLVKQIVSTIIAQVEGIQNA